mgnify:CR=1 FL=1
MKFLSRVFDCACVLFILWYGINWIADNPRKVKQSANTINKIMN